MMMADRYLPLADSWVRCLLVGGFVAAAVPWLRGTGDPMLLWFAGFCLFFGLVFTRPVRREDE